jgi:hypothetical protein
VDAASQLVGDGRVRQLVDPRAHRQRAFEQRLVGLAAPGGHRVQGARGELHAPRRPVHGAIERQGGGKALFEPGADLVHPLVESHPRVGARERVQEQQARTIGERRGQLVEVHPGEVVHGGADLTRVQAGSRSQRHRGGRPHGSTPFLGGALEDVGGLHDVRERSSGQPGEHGPSVQPEQKSTVVDAAFQAWEGLLELQQRLPGVGEPPLRHDGLDVGLRHRRARPVVRPATHRSHPTLGCRAPVRSVT